MQPGKQSILSVRKRAWALFSLLNDKNRCMWNKVASLHFSCDHPINQIQNSTSSFFLRKYFIMVLCF